MRRNGVGPAIVLFAGILAGLVILVYAVSLTL